MKKTILTGIITGLIVTASLFLWGCRSPVSGAKLKIAADGQTGYVIITGANATEAEKFAARELGDFLEKMCGTPFKTVTEENARNITNGIYVGWTEFGRSQGVNYAALGSEEWIIRTVNNNLIIAGGRPRGTLFGVYEFLEKYGGCAWLGKNTDVIPVKTTFLIPAINEKAKPAFWQRGWEGDKSAGLLFRIRNKNSYHSSTDAKYGYDEKCGSYGGCHTFYVLSKDWPTNHPEYFAINENGERPRPVSANGPGQICPSNPDVRRLVLQKVREYIRADREKAQKEGYPPPRIYDISHNDCMGACVCPGCNAILEREGAYSGVLLDFINEIARGIKKEYPDIYIQTFAYTFTLEPPKHIRPEDNVIIRICDLGSEWYPITVSENMRSALHPDNLPFQKTLAGWSKIAKHLAIWDYWIMYKNFQFPYANVSSIQPDLKYFRDNRVELILVECEDGDKTSFSALKQWLGFKMMQNPDRPAKDLIAKFMAGYYGPAAGCMREYLDYLEKRIADTPGSFGRIQPTEWQYLDLPFFIRVNELLDKADALSASNRLYSLHVRQERVPVDFALLHLWDKLAGRLPKDQKMPFDRNAVIERYAKNRGDVISDFFGGERLEKQKSDLANDVRLFKAMPIPLPEQFKGMKVVDILWPDFPTGRIADDNMAAGGRAYKLGANPENKDDRTFHDKPLNINLNNPAISKENCPFIKLKPEEIPQDGKYHFYKVGRLPIGDRACLWAHTSGAIRIYLTKAYVPPLVKEMDVYVSMKLLGPAYVKGSKDENSIFIDRVILADPGEQVKTAEQK